MIIIDTDMIKQLVVATSSANEAINDAVCSLEQITTHNDWGCREKNSINDYTIRNKNTIRVLQEQSRNFLNVLKQVSGEFETSENTIVNMFSSVEMMLADILKMDSLMRDNSLQNGYGGFRKIWDQVITEKITTGVFKDIWGGLGSFEIENIYRDIPICNFEDIEL